MRTQQTAYNEWLLKYGFNIIPVRQLYKDNTYFLVFLMHDYKVNDLLKRKQLVVSEITYQLKTPEELQ